jgi:tetratricopeptide (TPR) repeat protein
MQEPNSAALEAEFHQALALHRQGRLADAERGYQEVLLRQPHHFDAVYLLGVITLQTRRLELASELFAKAIALRPGFTEAYNNRGAALADLGRLDDALANYDQAIISARTTIVARHWPAWDVSPRPCRATNPRSRCDRIPQMLT